MAASCGRFFSRVLLSQPSRSCVVSKARVFRYSSTLQNDFEKAKERLNTLKEDPGNETKLKIYALFKQSTVGKCNSPKPGAFDFVGKAKWNAWDSLGDLSQDDAKKKYIELVAELAGPEAPADSDAGVESEAEKPRFEDIVVTNENGIYTIKKNRPKKKNAITWKMYLEIMEALEEADKDASVKLAVITGEGDFYCSGNDLSNFTNIPPEGPQKMARDARDVLMKYTNSYIDFSKPLIAAVNGPAVGIAVTVLGLCDLVYASDSATFHTPFMSLGQSPEGCSSLTFPRIMGYAKANEVLLMGKKLTAQQAYDRGLVTDVFLESEFNREVQKRITEMSTLPPKSLTYSKALMRGIDVKDLKEANERECLRLEERWLSEECMNAVMSFLAKRK
ncbi:enoyl-CoA delta isomerase 2-like [Rhopilema esculentum]|uniref:enoyl-CoA delta isomerase 2-like n=1 Tax=Rhopilema esculentum TaxID=499914 RepID=UPI0031E136E7|eukprot:gene1441-15866_t